MIRRRLGNARYLIEPAAVAVSVNRPYYTVSVAGLFRLKTALGRAHRTSSRETQTNADAGSGARRDRRKNTGQL